jgi:hypothetical protein
LSNIEVIFVSITALVKTKTPVGDLSGSSNQTGVLLGDLKRTRSSDEVKVEDSTNGVIFETVAVGFGSEFDVHAVRV